MQRNATPEDFEAVFAIYNDPRNNPFMTFEIMERSEFQSLFVSMLQAQDLYVFEVEGQIASAYRIQRKTHRLRHIAYFGSFAMHPNFRGQGIGKRIMRELLARLASEGIRRIELVVVCDNLRALEFYRSLGFQQEGLLRGVLKRANSPEFLDQFLLAKPLGEAASLEGLETSS